MPGPMTSPRAKLAHVGEGRWGAVPLGWLPHLRGRTLAVYVALAAHADPDGYCFPAKKTIAEASGIREDYVRLELRKLEKIGAIKTEQRFRQSSRYRLVPPPNEGTQIEGAQIEDRGDSFQVNEGTQNEGTRGLELSPHNKPRNISINRTGDGKEKTDEEADDLANQYRFHQGIQRVLKSMTQG
jgi:hypothetical protein